MQDLSPSLHWLVVMIGLYRWIVYSSCCMPVSMDLLESDGQTHVGQEIVVVLAPEGDQDMRIVNRAVIVFPASTRIGLDSVIELLVDSSWHLEEHMSCD